MALTDENTVLILGAGVSVPFGLPTGTQLIDDISKSLSSEINSLKEASNHSYSYSHIIKSNVMNKRSELFSFQALYWKFEQRNNEYNFNDDIKKMQELSILLENQTSDSIDDFIIQNPSYAEYAKICISAEFIKSLYKFKNFDFDRICELKKIDQRFLEKENNKKSEQKNTEQPERNWIHRLINLVRLGVEQGTVSKDNKIQIVTFNYDTILECVLEKQFSNVENGLRKFSQYTDFIEIIHVHGQCGELSEILYRPSKTCWEWSQGIKVIREGSDNITDEIKAARETAVNIISNATEIYCCGFAFAKANTDLLDLHNYKHDRRKIFYCNYSNDIGLRKAAEKFYIPHKHPYNRVIPSEVIAENNIGVADWIGIGTLGELP